MNLGRIYKQGLLVLLSLAVATALLGWKKFPLSIFIGGLLGLANLRGLVWGLRDFAASRPTGRVIFWSMVRFFLIGLILFILALLDLIHFVGILIGFTVVFALILREGLRVAREQTAMAAPDDANQSFEAPEIEK